jgi:cation transport regulator
MPYKKTGDLPKQVKDNLPPHAQEIFKEAYNSAKKEYRDKDKRRDPKDDLEEVAARIAWGAVKKKYHKSESSDKWVAND